VCGRYGSIRSTTVLAERFRAEPVPEALEPPPSWNVAPTQPVRAVRERPERGRQLVTLRWGLVPSWADNPSIGSRMINARVESAPRARAFRSALARRRCILPADGFYEWERIENGTKRGARQPHWFVRADGDVLALAGLWEAWRDAGGELWRTATILTTAANADVAGIHDRMPLVLEPGTWDEWLSIEERSPGQLAHLLAPVPDGTLVHHPVSDEVNKATADGPELIEEVAEKEKGRAPSSQGRLEID
jgi:putative SOS response-associated peptidase YedK